ncbi:hypothetical protein MBM_04876 [Drepanopeziza brunnea f. sp. 'multigermtubi' MB_m1]|uniref:Uncharacterized protein n=1 Tax=Marssonina brunnea f. sp. multigermtubi (strain MB_m1) TaxID=1072389 RepID=K1XX10_MARBU|nr:uncharacterized protein MBM_04876 [Drepanopeziza brunnea f. sp. 'multigermtubi' MB_m1]EKD17299.1 hypothetical protein MBM_04876 [Drepanopeziza brunnea f. sp. 'multigermtubi' MB_m1]
MSQWQADRDRNTYGLASNPQDQPNKRPRLENEPAPAIIAEGAEHTSIAKPTPATAPIHKMPNLHALYHPYGPAPEGKAQQVERVEVEAFATFIGEHSNPTRSYLTPIPLPAGKLSRWQAVRTKSADDLILDRKTKQRRVDVTTVTLISEASGNSGSALGIEMDGGLKKPTWKCLTWPLDELDDPAEDEAANEAEIEHHGPESNFSIPVPINSPQALRSRLAKKFVFNTSELKMMLRFMRIHRTSKVTGHKEDFAELLQHLGYSNSNLEAKECIQLRTKTQNKIRSLESSLRKSGAIESGYENAPLHFAEWTIIWQKPGWDGSISKPSQADYMKAMNINAGAVGVAAGASGSKPGGVYDGMELFVVEEPEFSDEPAMGANQSAEDGGYVGGSGGADPNKWCNRELIQETIDSSDWNYRVVAAQNLGLNLSDHAVLANDPFPGFEYSGPIVETPVVPAATHAVRAPATPKNLDQVISLDVSPTASLSASANKSHSLGDVDSHSDEDVARYAIFAELARVPDENLYDAESDTEILDDHSMVDSQQTCGSESTTEATASPPACPTTPVRQASRQNIEPATPFSNRLSAATPHTPGSAIMAVWSPKDD